MYLNGRKHRKEDCKFASKEKWTGKSGVDIPVGNQCDDSRIPVFDRRGLAGPEIWNLPDSTPTDCRNSRRWVKCL